MEDNAQSNENAVNNPSTEAGENNDGMVSQSVFQSRLSKISSQKNEATARADEMSARVVELEAKETERIEADRMLKGEQDVIISEQKLRIEALTKIETAYNTKDAADRERYMARLSDADKEFGEGMETSKLGKFSEGRVQNPNAGKTNSQRQGVTPNGGEFGGYNSPQEWANRDPQGYKNARNPLNSNNGIKIAYE